MATSVSLGENLSADGVAITILDRMIWPILLVFALGTAVFVPNTFNNLSSLEFIIHGSVALGFLALAECVCLISGNFDLSIGSIAGFSAVFTAMVISPNAWGLVASPILGILIIVAVGGLIGMVNGVMITKVGINPFLQTLSFLIIFEGAKLALTTRTVTGLPDTYTMIGGTASIAIGSLFAAFVLVGFCMRYTSFGQAVYGIGSSEESAREVGVDTDLHVIIVYAISGVLSGIGGLMVSGYVSVVEPAVANDLLFPAFSAAVLGGISLYGGRGRITGALGGVLLLALIQAALNIGGTPPEQIQLVNGVVLLLAIILYNTRNQIRTRILSAGM